MRPIFPNYTQFAGGYLYPADNVYLWGNSFSVTAVSGDGNRINIAGSVPGTNPSINAVGVDANIGIIFNVKGTGAFNFIGSTFITNGSVSIDTVGRGLRIKTGVNARIGQATLVAGTVFIANTSVTANTRFSHSVSAVAGAQGFLSFIPNPGVGFTINSSSGTDASKVDWILTESVP